MGVFVRTVGERGGGTAMAGKHTAKTQSGEEKARLSIDSSSRADKRTIGMAAFINTPVLATTLLHTQERIQHSQPQRLLLSRAFYKHTQSVRYRV